MYEQESVLTLNGIDDRIELSKGFPDLDKAITIEFWAKGENSLAEETTILEAYNAQNTRVLQISLPWGSQTDTCIVWDAGNQDGFDRIDKKVKIREYNVWTHWAFVKNAARGRMYIYRNGLLWHRGNGHNRIITGIEKLVIGSSVNASHYWKGSLAEFYVWSKARTQAEIQQDMNQRRVGDEPGLSAYLPLNGDANDKTSYANHGIIYGTSWKLEKLPAKVEGTFKSKTKPKKRTQSRTKFSQFSKHETLDSKLESLLAIIIDEPSSESESAEPISESTQPIIIEKISNSETIEPSQLASVIKKKRLVVCCDGTWHQLGISSPTNVLKLARSIKYNADDQTPQIVSYLSGGCTAEYDDLIERLGGSALGWLIDRIIQDAYRFLCLNYNIDAQDEIFLVGFSRGAYTVRCLAGMIYKCGLLKRSKIHEIPKAYHLYRDDKISPNSRKAQIFREDNSQKIDTEKDYLQYRVPIKMLGCWDTVGALGIPDLIPWLPITKLWNQKYQFFDTTLSPIVENAFHAVAIDEKRKIFPSAPMEKNEKNPDQVVKEVLFVGEHSCIGGGIKQYQGLSDYPLQWMLHQAQKLGLEFYSPENDSEALQINPDATTKFDNSVTGVYAFGGEQSRSLKSSTVIVHHSVVKRLKACPDYRPPTLNLVLDNLLQSEC